MLQWLGEDQEEVASRLRSSSSCVHDIPCTCYSRFFDVLQDLVAGGLLEVRPLCRRCKHLDRPERLTLASSNN